MAATPAQVRPGLETELEMLAASPDPRVLVVLAPYRPAALRLRWSAFLAGALNGT